MKLSLLSLIFVSSVAFASEGGQLVSPLTKEAKSVEAIAATIRPGEVIVVGEEHDFKPDHENQVRLLKALAARPNLAISVGMEFFEYPRQGLVDQFTAGQIAEPEFLKQVAWGGNDFSQYREQVLFPQAHAGKTFALNLPRQVANKIAMQGLDALSPQEAALLPPSFTLGRDSYRTRFAEYLKQVHGDVPPEMVDGFFAAQSAWDDTMAWKASLAMQENPNQVLVIIVGKFHVQYGGGLPDRLHARGLNNVLTLTQIPANASPEERQAALTPDATYGAVSDLVWVQE